MIRQTGLLYEVRPTDYITGASPIIIEDINTNGDWTKYLPTGEKQYKLATFDTFSCTTFMFLNAIETAVNFFRDSKQFTDEQIATLNSIGFYADGKFNCSDRFTAIMSGTMPNGNYFQNVGDSVRKDGLLPEALLIFGGNNQSEYLDKSLITEDMKSTAKKILDIIDIKYEWTTIDDFKTKLKQCPLGGAIFDGTHAVMIPVYNKYFDSYEPYLKKLPKVSYAIKVIVSIKKPMSQYKYFNEKQDPKMIGVNPKLMKILDSIREGCGFSISINSGFRTKEENAKLKGSVEDSAHLLGLAVDVNINTGAKRIKFVTSAVKHGIKRIGLGSTFCHIDIDNSKPDSIWFY